MAVIDPTTTTGKLRLRVGDTSDLPILSDAIYEQTYIDSGNSLNRATVTCAQYILALLSQNSHQKLVNVEIWGAEAFRNYLDFIKMVITNPNLSQVAPVPYSASNDTIHPLIQFTDDWYGNFTAGTQSEQLECDSINSGVSL